MKLHPMLQKSPEWFAKKLGKVSGTQLKGIMGTPKARQESLYDIIGERLKVTLSSTPEYENPLDRGNRLEPEALARYQIETGLEVVKMGFCEHDDEEFIGNSPDGLIDGGKGAIEIKCPEHKNYVKYWLINEIPDDYIWQVTQYFIVNEKLEWLDFVAYNPEIPVHPIHIIRTTRADLVEKIEQAYQKEVEFLSEVNTILEGIIEF